MRDKSKVIEWLVSSKVFKFFNITTKEELFIMIFQFFKFGLV